MIGAGWVTEYHLRAWAKAADRAEVVAIADPSGPARESRAHEFGIPATWPDGAAMLAAEKLDAVDICAPREFHADLVRLAAGAGLPILCQKPLATTFPDARRLVADIGSSVPLMVHENWRFRAWYRLMHAWLGEGLAGDLRQVQVEFLSSGMIPGADGSRFAVVRQPFFRTLDRLLVMEVLIHHLDTLRYLLGELEVVSARLQRTNPEIIGEDVASIVLRRTADGLPVVVSGNLAVHGAPPLPHERLRMFGAAGTLQLDGTALSLAGPVPRNEQFDAGWTYQDSYDQVIVHFLDGLDGKVPFETAPADNLRTLELVEQIYERAGPVLVG
jgi:predicted dehydrogenase